MNMRPQKIFFKKNFSLGSWITFTNVASAEIMAKSGFDWLAIDMEHSAITLYHTQRLIQVIDLAGCASFVRVGENNPNLIKRVMDAGTCGVIVPMVNSKDDAIKAVNAVKYPPLGTRGVGLARAQGYGLDFEKYKKWVNKNSIVIAQIEHIEAIDALPEILTVRGVDASMIGPYDLSASLGYPGDFKRKEFRSALRRYLEVCKEFNKPAGIHSVTPDCASLKGRIKEGFKFAAFSFDALFLGQKIKDELKKFRK